jgi:hypothetical protein
MVQYVSAFWNLATVVDIFVNLWFSFHFFKQHRIEQTIVWATSHSHQLTEQKVVGRLGWAAIGAWSVFFATASFLAYGCSQTDEGMQLVVCLASDAWAFALIWSQLMHLCFLWLWVNWAGAGTDCGNRAGFDKRQQRQQRTTSNLLPEARLLPSFLDLYHVCAIIA